MDNFIPADNNYFTFKGRLARGSFIKRTLLCYLVFIICLSVLYYPGAPLGKLAYLVFVPIFIFGIMLYANMNRRIHDIGRSSKWTWAMFFASNALPPLYFIALLYLFCKKGDEDSNEYGPNPLQ